jgi:hypothetical protein
MYDWAIKIQVQPHFSRRYCIIKSFAEQIIKNILVFSVFTEFLDWWIIIIYYYFILHLEYYLKVVYGGSSVVDNERY